MKRALTLLLIILLAAPTAFAKPCCSDKDHYDFERDYKCTQLIQKIRFQKNTLYNVLGLSPQQQELKDEIEFRRKEETKPYVEAYQCELKKLRSLGKTAYNSPEYKKQEKVTRKAWKTMQKHFKKYDREFVKILCSTQKSKYKEIVRLTKRDVRYCYLNKKCCYKDPYMNTFGKNDAKNLCEVCDKHSRPHMFRHKCKTGN